MYSKSDERIGGYKKKNPNRVEKEWIGICVSQDKLGYAVAKKCFANKLSFHSLKANRIKWLAR